MLQTLIFLPVQANLCAKFCTVSGGYPLWLKEESNFFFFFCIFVFLWLLFRYLVLICGCWKGRNLLQLSYCKSSMLSEGTVCASVEESLYDPAHLIFMFHFVTIWKKKMIDLIRLTRYLFFSLFHLFSCIPVSLFYLLLWQLQCNVSLVDTTPSLGPFIWQWCPSCCSFCFQKGKNSPMAIGDGK